MSAMGPRHCRCCGEEERTSGCVPGMFCQCSEAECPVCKFCPKHCNCTQAMHAEAIAAQLQYQARLRRITELNLARVNARAGGKCHKAT